MLTYTEAEKTIADLLATAQEPNGPAFSKEFRGECIECGAIGQCCLQLVVGGGKPARVEGPICWKRCREE